ncbi:MAG: histidinol-phosphatase HisJ [Candidatus Hodarchaeales archaeon]|jgi:histidinol-phosphatase (PHP family)
MLIPGDYHTHSYHCNHAIGDLEEYIFQAIELKLPELGLSAHFPMYLLPEQFHNYAMKKELLGSYLQDTRELKNKYHSKIIIKRALEVDYYTPIFNQYKNALQPILSELDYIIGSIHGISWNGTVIPIYRAFSSPANSDTSDTDSLFMKYYNELNKLVKTDFYDVLGHFDVIKKLKLPITDQPLIWESILKVIDTLEGSSMVVEINTSGLRKQNELYPQPMIIQELIDRKIPLILGSDAHNPEHVGYAFEKTLDFLKKTGLKQLCRISMHQKEFVKIN